MTMPLLQRTVRAARRVFPRGWSLILKASARVFPFLREYRVGLEDGDTLYVDLSQAMCMGYFFHGHLPHEIGVQRVLAEFLRDGGVFVDVGANVGYHTRKAARLVGRTGKVIAVEPQPAALGLLRKNSSDLPNVTILPLAASHTPGSAQFYIKPAGDTSSLDPGGATSAVTVRVSTIDIELRDLHRVDLIKIDVEGFELDVLRGALQTLRKHRPAICFEYLDSYATRLGISIEDFARVLSPFGYSLHWVNPERGAGSLTRDKSSSDVLALPAVR